MGINKVSERAAVRRQQVLDRFGGDRQLYAIAHAGVDRMAQKEADPRRRGRAGGLKGGTFYVMKGKRYLMRSGGDEFQRSTLDLSSAHAFHGQKDAERAQQAAGKGWEVKPAAEVLSRLPQARRRNSYQGRGF